MNDIEFMLNILDGYTLTFGKHKGHTLFQVHDADRQYLAWLSRQDWTAEKFPEVTAYVNALKAADARQCEGTLNGEACPRKVMYPPCFCHAHFMAGQDDRGLDLVTCAREGCRNVAKSGDLCGIHKPRGARTVPLSAQPA